MEAHSNSVTNGTPRTNILTVSLSKSITGEPIAEVLERDWQKADARTTSLFNNVGFDVDPTDFPKALQDFRDTLQGGHWDGILIGWCLRGYPERTEKFEQVIDVCVEELRAMPRTKLLFSTGPKNLYETTMRNFGP